MHNIVIAVTVERSTFYVEFSYVVACKKDDSKLRFV